MATSTSDRRVALVTGATSGIGRATAVAPGRDRERGAAALAEIRDASGSGTAELLLCDLASPAAVRDAAAEVANPTRRLDVLVNSAGAIYGTQDVTPEGFERTFAGNHLGPFLLTNLLLPLIERGAPARVVNVTSAMHSMVREMAWDDLQLEREFPGLGPTRRASSRTSSSHASLRDASRGRGSPSTPSTRVSCAPASVHPRVA